MDQAQALTKARQFADLAYSAEMNDAAKEFSTKRQAIQAQLAARGVVLSGTMTDETARLSGEQVNKLVTKRLDLLLEGYAMHGVEITDEIAAQTFDDVMKSPFEIFHDDKNLVTVFADLMDRADVGMIQSRSRACFTAETLKSLRILG